MNATKRELRPAGKGFVLAATGDGFPPMRRLVEAYICQKNKKYIKLNGEISPLLPSHMYMSGN